MLQSTLPVARREALAASVNEGLFSPSSQASDSAQSHLLGRGGTMKVPLRVLARDEREIRAYPKVIGAWHTYLCFSEVDLIDSRRTCLSSYASFSTSQS